MSEKNDPNNKSKPNTIKFGLISQESTYINVFDLINSYLKNSKTSNYNIKDENHYEFSPHSLPTITINIYKLKKIENIIEKYQYFNFFMIFIDAQNSNTNDFLEKAVDTIVDAGENNYNKKCYILGFFKEENNEIIPEEKITTILEAKGIDYYYCQNKDDDIKNFTKSLDRIINDSNTIMVEKYLDQKHSELILDHSNSHCSVY